MSLKHLGVKTPVEVSITLVDNDEIQAINLEQREKDQATDVLSFPMVDYDPFEDINQAIMAETPNPDTGERYLGDIVISIDKVMEQAQAYNHSFERELSFLVVHSMLHLLGFDHMESSMEEEMIGHQKAIMTLLGIER